MAIHAQAGHLPGERSRSFPAIMAGVGCRRGVAAAEVIALVEACFAEAGLPTDCLVALGTHERKAHEPAMLAAAAWFGVPLRLFSNDELGAGVSEPVARLAGELLLPKRKSAGATCALGRVQPRSSAAMASSTLATSSAGP